MRTAASTLPLHPTGRHRAERRGFNLKKMQVVDLTLKILVPAMLLVFFMISLHYGSLDGYLQLLSRRSYAAFIPALGAAYTLALLLFQIVRTVLWGLYRPYALPAGELPKVTVIIPAYNEGEMVEKAISAVVASDYPHDKLEVICIDDGSKDDTWHYIQRAAGRFPHLIKAVQFPHNRGKKAGLYAGFTQGQGEIFVTIDSDSVISHDTLRQVVAPMMQDAKVGAVAGNVKVYNRHQSLLGKMLAVRFVLSFDFLRASQSRYGGVTCTPGALSAYRRAAVLPHVDAWLNQTFLGAPCQHSEDRALTNFVLRAGYYSVYQRTAIVHTLVPETYTGLCKMYLRWERGNVRESFVQLGYLFTNYRKKDRLLPIVDFFMTQIEFPLTYLFLGLLLGSIVVYPLVFIKFLAALGVISAIYMIYYLVLEKDLDFIYGVIYSYYAFFFLQWIYPYAFLTVRNRHWLTR
ncbi:glycosyltransferase family 2 protein [Desulfobacca acetoxidans]|uniref:N-acetylglucosaminyltransferase n=1 Tax=Desulfobacca acetoxidans (strain ATCC 700848 / DSM 11109 / ASRB2) TaxID=880072 RepID=F2NEG3_DESAR|nr:glycosyltransferase [Desulfobacca acetoxidans]AEB08153.1 Hyaluronan synthase [Desulfobacca acetoxidans DSM 11109]